MSDFENKSNELDELSLLADLIREVGKLVNAITCRHQERKKFEKTKKLHSECCGATTDTKENWEEHVEIGSKEEKYWIVKDYQYTGPEGNTRNLNGVLMKGLGYNPEDGKLELELEGESLHIPIGACDPYFGKLPERDYSKINNPADTVVNLGECNASSTETN